MNELINILSNNGILVVSSREIAINFEKKHKSVLRAIEFMLDSFSLLEARGRHTSAPTPLNQCIPSEYEDTQGKMQKEYFLAKDACYLLVFGFTGPKARKFKVDYINKFNRMEEALALKEDIVSVETFSGINDPSKMRMADFHKLAPKHLNMQEAYTWIFKNVQLVWEKKHERDTKKELDRALNARTEKMLIEAATEVEG